MRATLLLVFATLTNMANAVSWFISTVLFREWVQFAQSVRAAESLRGMTVVRLLQSPGSFLSVFETFGPSAADE